MKTINTKLSRDEERRATFYNTNYQRVQQATLITPNPEQYRKDDTERILLKRAKAQWKNGLKAYYGNDWKKHTNVPISL